MRWLLIFSLLLSLGWSIPALAQTTEQFYDHTTLVYWQGRYQKSMQEMLDVGLRPFMNTEEQQRLADVKLLIPLPDELGREVEAQERVDPFLYYSNAEAHTVVMPALSLTFLYDFSYAVAWLRTHDCSLETPFEYISMLKYNGAERFRNGQYPAPLQALQIPQDDQANEAIDEMALRFFNTARAFILAHELGHIYHQHSGYGPHISREQARQHEREADTFALGLLRRSATIPMGMLFYFMAVAHWNNNRWDFATQAEWENALMQSTHPFVAERLKAMATTLEKNTESFTRGQPNPAEARFIIRFIATNLAGIAQHLDDEDVQLAIKLTASANMDRPQNLVPRCKQNPTPSPTAVQSPFTGIYQGDYIRFVSGDAESFPIVITFQPHGERVDGDFNFGLGAIGFTGIVEDEFTLYFDWQWGRFYGKGRLVATADGKTFQGTWGYGASDSNGGQLKGYRE